jgi:hypothetical protein
MCGMRCSMLIQENCGNKSCCFANSFDDLLSRVKRVLTTGRLQWHREETVERDIG